MITKAIVQSVNANGTRCVVRMPLFETPASVIPVEAEAIVSVTPGVFNNLVVNDVVLVAFEENAMEKPVILGKLFMGANTEGNIRGGGGVFNTIKVNSEANLPASTSFVFPVNLRNAYKQFKTPKSTADYIKWLESFTKSGMNQLEDNFSCFKNWTQWQLQAENIEVDDGDLDIDAVLSTPFQYQEEGKSCRICKTCTKNNTRRYLKVTSDNEYPNI